MSDATIDETSAINAVTGQPMSAQAAPLVAPPGAPNVGVWVEDRYCGLTTWLITLIPTSSFSCFCPALIAILPCSYFCPCDRRAVWIGNGMKYNEKGAVVDDHLFIILPH